ncbi:hypothetical protein EM868_17825 [Cupriavidus gilardii]|uniref:hypothetical protein n=1 Tax=Cupriavidus gilardii TaxID=82541 RepID=UPI001EE6043A|nr:hypothetical protein [Cupriavidus gilardii]MCG5262689.1 hypothetical protein [Cupriavidus gilardii]MDF9431637.1 hypothetical protein [Cupriavidus gilardii]
MTANEGFIAANRTAAQPDAGAPASDRSNAVKPRAPWWQPGVYCSAPAVFLWIASRLPEEMLAQLFRGASMPLVLNQLGDALFFCGWVISAILLWGSRRQPPAA